MKKIFTLLSVLLLLGTATIYAQNITIKGTVKDNSTNNTMPGATVLLLNEIDSSFYKFGTSNTNGNFVLDQVKPGNYVFQVSFIGYETHYKAVTINEEPKTLEYEDILLKTKSENIKEVEVVDEMIPIRLKNDTVEYNADAFNTNPEDNVSELLKKLPGVEVDRDGTVKAQGEQVQKVLVDGKEFFGNDTKLATENLPADMVKKVQVYDDQSDLSKITGIDDGERTKTINLKIKKDRKKGLFGTVEVGGGVDNETNAMYDNRFNVNKFKDDMQLSTLGMINNTNKQGFSYRDYVNFVGGGQNLGQGGFRNIQNNNNGIPISSGSANDGLTETFAGGINLNYDFNPATTFSGNYFYNRLDKDITSISNKQYLTGNDSTDFKALENEIENQLNDNHRLNLKLVQKLDSSQTLTVTGNLIYSESRNDIFSKNDNISYDGYYINRSTATNNYDGNYYSATGGLVYGKRFAKKGRSLVFNLNANGANNDKNFNILNFNDFILVDTMTKQFQNELTKDLSYDGKVAYTEPIAKNTYLELRYQYQNYQTDYNKDFFDIDPLTASENFNQNLSLLYDNSYQFHKYGTGIKLNTGKSNITIGADVQNAYLDGEILNQNTTITNSNIFVLPNFKWRYNTNKTSRISFNYNTNVQQPSINQLQPTIDNSNPLYLYQGNPDLKPEYTHSGRLHYFMFNQFSFTNVFAMLRGNYTTNKITNAQTFDQLRVQTTRPVNVDYDYSVTGYLYFGTPIRKLGTKINLSTNSTYTNGLAFVNNVENVVERNITSFDASVENRNKDVIDLKIGTKFSYNETRYSENTGLNQDYISTEYYGDLFIDFLKTWSFNTNLSYTFYNGDNFTDNPSLPIWRAYISKRLFKSNKGLLKVAVYDILNQNIGINRVSENNYIEDTRITSLGRYYLVSLSYKITRFGGKKKKK